MCGIPYHAANGYILRLTQKGYKVAVVEQLEDPATAKGIVQRGCIRIITPGTVMDENGNEKESVYLASLIDYQYGIAAVYCEMTTGDMHAQVILPNNFDKKYIKLIEDFETVTISMFNDIQLKDEYRSLVEAIDNLHVQHAVGLLTNYLDETQKQKMEHLTPVVLLDEEDSLQMDFSTRQNLE